MSKISHTMAVIASLFLLAGCSGQSSPNENPEVSNEAVSTSSNDSISIEDLQRDAPLRYVQKLAVIVGINDYPKSFSQDLKQAENDALGFQEALVQELGYKKEEILLLQGASATRAALRNALGKWLNKKAVSQDDSVIFFFAGHGRDGYLAPSDADANKVKSTWLSMSEITSAMSQLDCRHKLLLLDSCYSGSLFSKQIEAPTTHGTPREATRNMRSRGAGDPTDGLESYLREPCFLAITAGYDSAVVDEMGNNGHSLFTWSLLQSIRERALSERTDQIFFGRMLAVDLERRVMRSRRNSQRVGWGYLSNQSSGDFVFEPQEDRPTVRGAVIEEFATAMQQAISSFAGDDRSKAVKLIDRFADKPQIRRRFDYRLAKSLLKDGERGETIREFYTPGESYPPLDEGEMHSDFLELSLSPDERYLVITKTNTVVVYDTHRLEQVGPTNAEGIHSIVFETTHPRLRYYSKKGEGIWNLSKNRGALEEEYGYKRVVQFNRGRSTIRANANSASLESNFSSFRLKPSITPLRSPDVNSNYCLGYSKSHDLYSIRADSGRIQKLPHRVENLASFAISNDGERLASFSLESMKLVLWDIARDYKIWELPLTPAFLPMPAALRFSPNRELLVITGGPRHSKKQSLLEKVWSGRSNYDEGGRRLYFIDVVTGKPVLHLPGLPDHVIDFAFNRSGDVLWVLYGNGLIERWQ